jgi:hypothetical protein
VAGYEDVDNAGRPNQALALDAPRTTTNRPNGLLDTANRRESSYPEGSGEKSFQQRRDLSNITMTREAKESEP